MSSGHAGAGRETCLFCRIADGDEHAEIVLTTDTAVVFRDIAPKAPEHLLVIPRRHLRDVVELCADPASAMGVLFAIREVSRRLEMPEFRTVFNTGVQGGQHVFHVHAHLLAGRTMTWPPG